MTMQRIRLENVSIAYAKNLAVKNISGTFEEEA